MTQRNLDDSQPEGPRRQSTRLHTATIKATTPSLCEYCASIRIQGGKERVGAIWTRSLKDAIKAANGPTKCTLCYYLTNRITFSEESIQSQTANLRTRQTVERNNEQPTQLVFALGPSETPLRYDICKMPAESTSNGVCVFEGKYREPTEKVDGNLRYLPRVVNSDPMSDATIGLVKDWLSSCRGPNHHFCKAQEPRPLPSRVIDVRTEAPKIIETNGLKGSYTALSHCWGPMVDTSTTKHNFAKRKTAGIDLTQMPANFRHAIQFTRRLGYDYIWIDSLCIIQQDAQDWRHEVGRMAGYYNNAFLTLSIADAHSCHDGFLHQRRYDYSPAIPGDDGDFYCLREVLKQECHLNMDSSINKRAWTLQERLLSSRLIQFTREQLVWYCRSKELTEGYVYNSFRGHDEYRCDRAGHYIDRAEYDAYWEKRASNSAEKINFDTDIAAETWYHCVSEFTTRRLTRPSDKLPAMGGLANMFCQPELGRYIAGLWERDLFRGLAWMRVQPGERTREQYRSYIATKAKRNLEGGSYEPPLEYRAPSWSWASVNGPVEVSYPMFYAPNRGASENMQYEVQHWETNFAPRLLNSRLLHSTTDIYLDTLKGSFIELHGYYRKLWMSKTTFRADGPNGTFIKNILLDSGTSEQFSVYLTQPDLPDCTELLMFQICKQRRSDRLVYALLLEKMAEVDGYKRIGLVELACYNLCKIPQKQPGSCFVYYLHPLHQSYSDFKPHHYKTKEWLKDRWTEGDLKLF